jgi:hypothetical protein
VLEYKGYQIIGKPKQGINGRWISNVDIRKMINGKWVKIIFSAEKSSAYILEIEAKKESENLGKQMIDRNMVGF